MGKVTTRHEKSLTISRPKMETVWNFGNRYSLKKRLFELTRGLFVDGIPLGG